MKREQQDFSLFAPPLKEEGDLQPLDPLPSNGGGFSLFAPPLKEAGDKTSFSLFAQPDMSPPDRNSVSALQTKQGELEGQAHAAGLGDVLAPVLSGVGHVADFLSRPNYAIAGAINEMQQPNGHPLERAAAELFRGLPGVTGAKKETFADVLEQAGVTEGPSIQAPFKLGKISSRGVAGLALDIFLDPTTYLTFGGKELAAVMQGGKNVGEIALSKEGRALVNKIKTETRPQAMKYAEYLAQGHATNLPGVPATSRQWYRKAIDLQETMLKFGEEDLFDIAAYADKIAEEGAVSKVAQLAANGQKELIDRGGMKWMGKTIIPGETFGRPWQHFSGSVESFLNKSSPGRAMLSSAGTVYKGGTKFVSTIDRMFNEVGRLARRIPGLQQVITHRRDFEHKMLRNEYADVEEWLPEAMNKIKIDTTDLPQAYFKDKAMPLVKYITHAIDNPAVYPVDRIPEGYRAAIAYFKKAQDEKFHKEVLLGLIHSPGSHRENYIMHALANDPDELAAAFDVIAKSGPDPLRMPAIEFGPNGEARGFSTLDELMSTTDHWRSQGKHVPVIKPIEDARYLIFKRAENHWRGVTAHDMFGQVKALYGTSEGEAMMRASDALMPGIRRILNKHAAEATQRAETAFAEKVAAIETRGAMRATDVRLAGERQAEYALTEGTQHAEDVYNQVRSTPYMKQVPIEKPKPIEKPVVEAPAAPTGLQRLKIISGGQEGVDKVGLEVAREKGVKTGGTAPKGWRVTSGSDPSLEGFGLVQHPSRDWQPRTEANVKDADLTVIFADMGKDKTGRPLSPGSWLTRKYAVQHNKPLLINPTAELLAKEIEKTPNGVINIAGQRMINNPGASAMAKETLSKALDIVKKRAAEGPINEKAAKIVARQFDKEVFVFGSNEGGRHGMGAALTARNEHGAQYGIGEGPTGKAYAIPTKNKGMKVRQLADIQKSVDQFILHAKQNPTTKFNVTAIGTGLAGYTPADIAPMFKNAPDNVFLPHSFQLLLPESEAAQAAARQGDLFKAAREEAKAPPVPQAPEPPQKITYVEDVARTTEKAQVSSDLVLTRAQQKADAVRAKARADADAEIARAAKVRDKEIARAGRLDFNIQRAVNSKSPKPVMKWLKEQTSEVQSMFLIRKMRSASDLKDVYKITEDYAKVLSQLEPKMLTQVREVLDGVHRKAVDQMGEGHMFVPHKLPNGETNPLGGYYMPRVIHDEMMRMNNNILNTKEVGELIKKYDAVNDLFKIGVTLYHPAFHVRNGYSNVATNFVAIGLAALNPASYIEAARVMAGGLDGTLHTPFRRYTFSELRHMMVSFGIDKDFTQLAELSRSGRDPGNWRGVMTGRSGPKITQKAIGGVAALGGVIENGARGMLFMNYLKQGKSPEMAATLVKKFLFDYEQMSKFEQQVMSRLFPFYKWTKKNLSLTMRELVHQPGKYATMFKLGREGDSGPEADALPYYMRGNLKLKLQQGPGRATFITGLDLPAHSALNTIFNGNVLDTMRQNMGMLAPAIKTLAEVPLKRDFFSGRDLNQRANVNALGQVFSYMPRPVQDWMELSKSLNEQTGEWDYSMNGTKAYLLMRSYAHSRFLNEFDKLSTDTTELPGFTTWLVTGLQGKEIDLSMDQKKILRQRIRRLEDRLIQRGVLRQSRQTYEPKNTEY